MSGVRTFSESSRAATPAAEKRVILSMGGKGGVGKTSVMTGLAEWFCENDIPVKLLDLDTENKSRGSFAHFFHGEVPKVNINTPAGLDAFVDELTAGPPVILADMGAGAGQVTYDWFERMYPDVSEAGIVFTAIGVVGNDFKVKRMRQFTSKGIAGDDADLGAICRLPLSPELRILGSGAGRALRK